MAGPMNAFWVLSTNPHLWLFTVFHGHMTTFYGVSSGFTVFISGFLQKESIADNGLP